jgi:uncharacterized OB-fold protein
MSTTQRLSRDAPPPVADIDSAPFWDGTRAHRLMIQACSACGQLRFPPMPGCPHCGDPGGSWVEVSGDGSVYSWVRVHRTSNARFADSVPYVVATIELAPGCRMVAQLDQPGPVAIGSAVQPIYVDHEAWTEVRFRPRENGHVDG